MARIADASRHVVCQSEEMRALLESLVPATIGKTIILSPGVPVETVPRPDPGRIAMRMIYTGKFHPFYPLRWMIGAFRELRSEHPELEFHVAGDKFYHPKGDASYATGLERELLGTPGLHWHGGIGRDEVEALVAAGGVALSLWDYRHGPAMNNFVISTKLLDSCSVGIPILLNRTAAQEEVLGRDYPLFVSSVEEARPLLGRVLVDDDLRRQAAERCWSATRRFTYEAVLSRLRPYLARPSDPAVVRSAIADREKLPGASLTVGLRLSVDADDDAPGGGAGPDGIRASIGMALGLLRSVRLRDARFRLSVFTGGRPEPTDLARAVLSEDSMLERATSLETDLDADAWAMTVGWLILVGAAAARDVTDQASRADRAVGGSVPVPLPADGVGDPAVASAIDAAAAAIVAAVHEDRWRSLFDASRPHPGVHPEP